MDFAILYAGIALGLGFGLFFGVRPRSVVEWATLAAIALVWPAFVVWTFWPQENLK